MAKNSSTNRFPAGDAGIFERALRQQTGSDATPVPQVGDHDHPPDKEPADRRNTGDVVARPMAITWMCRSFKPRCSAPLTASPAGGTYSRAEPRGLFICWDLLGSR